MVHADIANSCLIVLCILLQHTVCSGSNTEGLQQYVLQPCTEAEQTLELKH